MCRNIISFIFIVAFIYGFMVANGYAIHKPEYENALTNEIYIVDPYGEEVENDIENNVQNDGEFAQYDGNYINKRSPGFTPYISVGALSNLHQFFENLKDNFKSLERLSDDQTRALSGYYLRNGECDPRKWKTTSPSQARKHSYIQGVKNLRPAATAAYFHAVRNQPSSARIRNYVANAEPRVLRGSNQYNPSYLWTGLGRRR